MLEHLFGSKTRTKLLTLFLHHPEKPFYVRELTRVIDTQINAVRRELENLSKIGMVKVVAEAPEKGGKPGVRRKYYMMNSAFPLQNEIRMLMMKSHLLMERNLKDEIADLGDIKFAALMGTFLGNTDAPVDLFLIGKINKGTSDAFIKKLERDLGFEVNFTCLELHDFTYRKDVGDRFLLSILESPKNVLIDTAGVTEEAVS